MRTKTLFVSVLLLAAFALSACGPAAVSQSAPRAMNVSGTGEVFLTPDIAYITIGVHTEKPSASDAMKENNAQSSRVIDALKRMGVDEKDIRTVNFSIYPSQSYGPDGSPLELKYAVDNSVYVTVRDLAKLGELLDSVVSSGANTVNSIQFDVADNKDALKQARAAAVESAKTQAQELADAAGIKLGDIIGISFSDSTPIPFYNSFGKGGGGALSADIVPIQPGQLIVTANVNITYEIK